jgi:hypothetical protein
MARALLAFAVLTPATMALAETAAASETRCVRGDDAVRRVEIQVQDPVSKVPCEVVYWKDTEQPGVRTVLWSAQTDADFCARNAEELVATLQEGGWSCDAAAAPQSASQEAPPATAAEPPRSASREMPPATAAEPPQSASREAPPAAAAEPPRSASQEAPPAAAAEPPRSEPPVAAPSPEGSAEPRVAEERPPQTAAPADGGRAGAPSVQAALAPSGDEAEPGGGATGGAPAGTTLDAIIEQNLVRLNDGVDGRFGAEIAEYGDLNGDGLDDGLVFFTYESDRLGKARFVAAYLFDGESYTLAATKPLAGSDDRVQSAEVESIEGGVISLRLSVLEQGDAACCPSGLRREALVLRGGQLIEAGSAASAPGRS